MRCDAEPLRIATAWSMDGAQWAVRSGYNDSMLGGFSLETLRCAKTAAEFCSSMPKKTKGSTAKAKAKTAVLGKSPAKAAKASASSGSGGLLVTIEACKT